MKLTVLGQNMDVVQKPMMKSVYNESIFEFVSVSRRHMEIGDGGHLFYRHVTLFQRHK